MRKYMNNGPSSQHPLLLGRQQPHPLSPSIQTINQDEAENPKKWSTPNKSYSTALGLCPQSLGFREVGLEPSPKRDSDNMLRQGKKTATENKSYRTTWTHIGEPSTLKGRRKTCAKNRQDRSPGESLRIAVNLASATRSAKPQTHWTWETLSDHLELEKSLAKSISSMLFSISKLAPSSKNYQFKQCPWLGHNWGCYIQR